MRNFTHGGAPGISVQLATEALIGRVGSPVGRDFEGVVAEHIEFVRLRAGRWPRWRLVWLTGPAALVGRQDRFLSKFRHDSNEARRLCLPHSGG